MPRDKVNIRIELTGEIREDFERIKKYYGMVRNTEVLRMLIAFKFNEIQRQSRTERLEIPVEPDLYKQLESRAKDQGLTIKEYVERRLEQWKESAEAT
jgi:hypothetical protein